MTDLNATVYTDEANAYNDLPFDHATVQHSLAEYVNGKAHTNATERSWSMLKRAHKVTCHKMTPDHLEHVMPQFPDKHCAGGYDTIAQT